MTEQNLVSELASFTDAGEHTKFQLLQNWQEYKFTRKVRYSLQVLVNSLQLSIDRQLKAYCKTVTTGNADVYSLLAFNYTRKILVFYLEELVIIEDMLYEYETYLASGNWLDFVFNLPRPADKLWDHRRY